MRECRSVPLLLLVVPSVASSCPGGAEERGHFAGARLQGFVNNNISVHDITGHVCRVFVHRRNYWHEPFAANCDDDGEGDVAEVG